MWNGRMTSWRAAACDSRPILDPPESGSVATLQNPRYSRTAPGLRCRRPPEYALELGHGNVRQDTIRLFFEQIEGQRIPEGGSTSSRHTWIEPPIFRRADYQCTTPTIPIGWVLCQPRRLGSS